MRNGSLQKVVALAACLIMLLSTSGCSVMGYTAGRAIDNHKPDYRTVKADQVLSMKFGTDMRLHLKDGSRRNGKFVGFTAKAPEGNTTVDTLSTLTFDQRRLIFQSSYFSDSSRVYEYIPVPSVDFAEVRNSKHARYIGLGIGLLFDLMIIASADFGLELGGAVSEGYSRAGE